MAVDYSFGSGVAVVVDRHGRHLPADSGTVRQTTELLDSPRMAGESPPPELVSRLEGSIRLYSAGDLRRGDRVRVEMTDGLSVLEFAAVIVNVEGQEVFYASDGPPINRNPAHDPFLGAIFAAPKDPSPRLIFADWLDEHGEPLAAEWLRLDVRLATSPRPLRLRRRLRKRFAKLRAHQPGVPSLDVLAHNERMENKRRFTGSVGISMNEARRLHSFAHFLEG